MSGHVQYRIYRVHRLHGGSTVHVYLLCASRPLSGSSNSLNHLRRSFEHLFLSFLRAYLFSRIESYRTVGRIWCAKRLHDVEWMNAHVCVCAVSMSQRHESLRAFYRRNANIQKRFVSFGSVAYLHNLVIRLILLCCLSEEAEASMCARIIAKRNLTHSHAPSLVCVCVRACAHMYGSHCTSEDKTIPLKTQRLTKNE